MPNQPELWVAIALILAVFGTLLVLGVLVLRDTVRRDGRWGINFKGLAGGACPQCAAPVPAVRVPKNVGQYLWGGWTCDKCGCEIDKWGRQATRTGRRLRDDRDRPRRGA